MSFKGFFKDKSKSPELNKMKDSDILNEMARWIDVLKLETDNILKSEITNKDNYIKNIKDLKLYVRNLGEHKIFKLAKNNIVLAYIQAKKHTKIDNRETLTIEVSRRSDELKGFGYGKSLYYFLLENYCILSDSQNTPDSINVWQSLFYDNDLENGVYNFKTKEVVVRNIVINPNDIGKIWKKIEIKDDNYINPDIGEILSYEELRVGLHYRVFVYKK